MTKAIETEWIDISLGATGQRNVGAIVLNALHGVTNGVTQAVDAVRLGPCKWCCRESQPAAELARTRGTKWGLSLRRPDCSMVRTASVMSRMEDMPLPRLTPARYRRCWWIVSSVLVVSLLLSFGVNHSDKLACRMASSIHQPEEQNEHTDWYDECRLFLHTHVEPELRLDKASPGQWPTLGPTPPGKDSDCARHKAPSSDVVPHSLRKSLFQVSTKVAPNGVTAPILVTTTRRRGGVVIFYLLLPQQERR